MGGNRDFGGGRRLSVKHSFIHEETEDMQEKLNAEKPYHSVPPDLVAAREEYENQQYLKKLEREKRKAQKVQEKDEDDSRYHNPNHQDLTEMHRRIPSFIQQLRLLEEHTSRRMDQVHTLEATDENNQYKDEAQEAREIPTPASDSDAAHTSTDARPGHADSEFLRQESAHGGCPMSAARLPPGLQRYQQQVNAPCGRHFRTSEEHDDKQTPETLSEMCRSGNSDVGERMKFTVKNSVIHVEGTEDKSSQSQAPTGARAWINYLHTVSPGSAIRRHCHALCESIQPVDNGGKFLWPTVLLGVLAYVSWKVPTIRHCLL